MKKIITISAVLIALIAIYLLNVSQHKSVTKTEKKDKHIMEYPGEWMYNQRAYPDNIINTQAIKNAELQVKNIKAQRKAGGQWEFAGPLNTGGRITDVAISPDNDNHFYVAAALGGVFKTTDRGVTWQPIFDNQGKLGMGNIEIAPSNANVLYVGTGEANGSATSGAFFGDGIYKSTDAGATWTNMGLPDSQHIARIVIDPTDENRVFVATTGILYGTNQERGVYRTEDGGTTWEKILFIAEGTAAIDIVINEQNPDILFAAMWERSRQPWVRDYGGLTSAVHRSTDSGTTWTELGATNGLPAPNEQTGRIGLAISSSNPNHVYARFTTNQVTNVFNGVYRSTDGGATFSEFVNGEISNVDSSFGWFFGNIRVNPNNLNEVYVLGQRLYRTLDAGASWNEVVGMHVDHHAMEFSRSNSNFILAGNDGGAYISEDNGNTWDKFLNLPITQFYNIEVDNLQPEQLYGGTQDNNTIRTVDGSLGGYNAIWGGDGFHVNVDPMDNNFIYVEAQFGNMGRSTDGGQSFNSSLDGIDQADRNNWNTPIVLSNVNPETVYYGSNKLYSSSRAETWTAISPDLTQGQHPSGATSYGTLTAIATSYNTTNTIYTGSDDGKVHVTFDGGTTWSDISAGLPDRYITAIATVPSNDDVAYVTLSGFTALDFDPHVFKTIDGGQSWTAIAGNLPNIPANDIVVTPDEEILIVATDAQVWYSVNDGLDWFLVGNNLPNTTIRDLKIHEGTNMLYAGTFGRAIHSYDLSQLLLSTPDFLTSETDITLYPNPAVDTFSIVHDVTGNGEIAMYNIAGQQIKILFSGNLDTANNKRFSINDLASGLYFVKLQTGKGEFVKRLLVK